MNMSTWAKRCVFIFTALATIRCSNPQQKKPLSQSVSNDKLFVWDRPILIPMNLPITQSATCRFKKGLSVGFMKLKTDPPTASEKIDYSVSDENESDTVAFVDLNTKTPKVQSNGGQATARVLYDDGERLTLLNNQQAAVEVYTIFRSKGVVIYSQQKDSVFIGSFGVIEMGYCN